MKEIEISVWSLDNEIVLEGYDKEAGKDIYYRVEQSDLFYTMSLIHEKYDRKNIDVVFRVLL